MSAFAVLQEPNHQGAGSREQGAPGVILLGHAGVLVTRGDNNPRVDRVDPDPSVSQLQGDRPVAQLQQ